jgi:hypothetical protein
MVLFCLSVAGDDERLKREIVAATTWCLGAAPVRETARSR